MGPLSKFRSAIVIKAFKAIDRSGDGVLDLDDIKQSYNAKFHPDVKAGKRNEDEVLREFLETFEQHHNTIHGTKADGKVTPDEFLEYYAHVSANIDNDQYFELMMANAWNIDSRNNPDAMPFAGSKKKITQVNSHEAYRADHHRNLFGTDKQAVFDKKASASDWSSSTKSTLEAGLRDPKGVDGKNVSFIASSQRTTGYTYRGVKNSDNELVAKFRKTLADRGIRGVVGMARSFKIMDDNKSGTLDI